MYFLNKISYWHNSCSILKSVHKHLVQPERHKLNTLLWKAERNNNKIISNLLSSSLSVLDQYISPLAKIHKKKTHGVRLGYWSQLIWSWNTQSHLENGYQIMQKWKAQNVVLLQPEWKAVIHKCPTEKQWAAQNCQAFLVGDTSIEYYVLTLQSVSGTHEPK